MKILTKKKYEEMAQTLTDSKMELQDALNDVQIYKTQAEVAMEQHDKDIKKIVELESKLSKQNISVNELQASLVEAQDKNIELDKTVRNLKRLLTKNKIDYKHLFKKNK